MQGAGGVLGYGGGKGLAVRGADGDGGAWCESCQMEGAAADVVAEVGGKAGDGGDARLFWQGIDEGVEAEL